MNPYFLCWDIALLCLLLISSSATFVGVMKEHFSGLWDGLSLMCRLNYFNHELCLANGQYKQGLGWLINFHYLCGVLTYTFLHSLGFLHELLFGAHVLMTLYVLFHIEPCNITYLRQKLYVWWLEVLCTACFWWLHGLERYASMYCFCPVKRKIETLRDCSIANSKVLLILHLPINCWKSEAKSRTKASFSLWRVTL